MKISSFLALLSITALGSVANAAESQTASDALALPTYVVESERDLTAEQQIQRSLAALRALANVPVGVTIELPALQGQVARVPHKLALVRVAKS
jgi:hypothetical protein